MNTTSLGLNTYPSKGYTSHGVLFDSLGTFWTKIFGDRAALRGLSIGQSEELIQQYYNFIETVNSLSVKTTPELHRSKWLPIKIQKSKLRRVPLKFLPKEDPNCAVFGPQPLPESSEDTNEALHYGEVFQFGKAKRPAEEQYVTDVSTTIKHIPLLANQVVAPTQVLSVNTDFWLRDGKIYFAKNPFDLPELTRYVLFSDDGAPLTYTWTRELYTYTPSSDAEFDEHLGPPDGTELPEEEIILWAYHAQVEANNLYDNFGYLFGFKEEDASSYKEILKGIVNIFTEGPTVQALTSIACAFAGVQSVQETGELLVDAYTVDNTRFVITDKRVYTSDLFHEFSDLIYHAGSSSPKIGVRLSKGDLLFNSVEYYDSPSSWRWWLTALDRVALPPYLFLGNYQGTLIFENLEGEDGILLEDIMTGEGELTFPFPSDVRTEDQAEFNAFISHPDRYDQVVALLTDCSETPNEVEGDGRVNPLDFIFRYFLRTNTALLKLRFKSLEAASKFMRFFYTIKGCLPKYLYLLIYFDFALPQDIASLWTNTTDAETLSSDGSDVDGWVQVPPYNDPPWTVDYGFPASPLSAIRPFVISRSLDLWNTYVDEGVTYYQNINNLAGDPELPQDLFDFSDSCAHGTDANNIPLAYQRTGQLGITTASTTVTGSSTKFLSEMTVGDLIYTNGDSYEYRLITAITDDTSLEVASAFSGTTRTIDCWTAQEKPSMQNTSGLLFWRIA